MTAGTNVESMPTGLSVKQGLLIAAGLMALQACICTLSAACRSVI
jgi:hypothetical protein